MSLIITVLTENARDNLIKMREFLIFFQHSYKTVEEVIRIMGSWRRFGMILNAESVVMVGIQSFDCVVIEVHVGDYGFIV